MNLVTQIIERRSAGRTTCATMPIDAAGAEPATIADRVVQAHGFRELHDGWLAISAADAHAIATALLYRDLAYQTKIMPIAEAADLATQFLDLAPEPHSYFTNGDWTTAIDANHTIATLNGWDPISDATFDSGVVCVGDGVAAILWVEDED
ncbi:MAG: hypothetical protein M3Y64_06980 [Gemmatimonadota bacterium]|nr:hypothetical protein [Gemmatimonadota bacterium]